MNRVVVTGYGAICPLGDNSGDIWQAIMRKERGYTRVDNPGEGINARFFGKIERPLNLRAFSKRILKNTPRFAQLALIAAKDAIAMAFADTHTPLAHYSPRQCGAIVGTGWGGFDDTAANFYQYREGTASIQSCFHTMPSIATSAVAINWGLKGYQNTPVAACATGNIAIGDAWALLKSGTVQMLLAGGAESTLTPFPVWSIDVLGALSKEQHDPVKACCPFSRERSGFVMSEGAAMLCLETLDNARRRNAVIYGEIVGYANHSDAWVNLTAPAPDYEGKIAAMTGALHSAGLTINEIDYINAHGTSTPANDVNETEVIKKVFGERAHSVPISSTKSYTGHLIAAAGAIETIFCLNSINGDVVPATINLRHPDPACDLDYVANEHRYLSQLKHVMNVNYGFGGANSCLIIKRMLND